MKTKRSTKRRKSPVVVNVDVDRKQLKMLLCEAAEQGFVYAAKMMKKVKRNLK